MLSPPLRAIAKGYWLTALCASAYWCAPALAQPTGLVAGYSFDQGSGSTAADISGNNLTGTLSGATWTPVGRFGGALSFDGVNDWVTVADANALDLTTGMTLEAWVFPTASGGGGVFWRNVLVKERTNGEAYNLYAADGANHPVVYVVRAAQAGVPLEAVGTGSVPLNVWTHLAATYDGTTLRLFVDGTQVASRAVSGALLTSTGVLRIGGNSIWGEHFQGSIDEVRIYNSALTAAQIQADMLTAVGNPPPDTEPPLLSNGLPTGTLSFGTTQTTLGVTTSEAATCRYGTNSGLAYSAMTGAFATTGTTAHSTPISGFVNGNSYSYFIRCQDAAGNANPSDFAVTFTIANPPLDSIPPVLSNALPSGTLPAGTAQTTLAITTNEPAVCRYEATPGVVFNAMTSTFASTGSTGHSSAVTGLTNGTAYTFYVRCQDPAGNANSSDALISFAVATAPPLDTTPPAVSMTAPAPAATLSGAVTLSATASDNVGVAGVQFLVDGSPVGAEDTSAPFSVSWNTALVGNGAHQISARARDAANNQTTSAPVSVTVSNAAVTGLVAAYGFDASSGTTAVDASGNNLTGTLSGATWTPVGRFGRALSFDGVNDWVTVADANALDLTTGMTLEAWVFPTASGGGGVFWRNVLVKERTNGEAYNLYAADGANHPVVYVVRAAQAGAPLEAVGTGSVPLNVWTHLAATYDGTTLRLFVDGTQVASRAVSGALLTSTGVLRIGGNSMWGEHFQGSIDEVRIYNSALTATQIQADMLTAVGNPPPDTAPPVLSNGLPTGILSSGTTQATLSIASNEPATCRYSATSGVAYAAMTGTFATTGGIAHSTAISGLNDGNSYAFYVRCRDALGNTNASDTSISFAVATITDLIVPPGALGYYTFSNAAGGSIPDQIQGAQALPSMVIRGADYGVSGAGITWNANIGSFTFAFPFDESRGTFAETPTSFANNFPTGGAIGIRLRIDPSVVANLGQGSGMGLITFRGDPDINVHRVAPRALEIRRDGPNDPLYFLAREGENSIGYNNEFNDEVRSAPLTNPTAEKTVIVVWTPSTLSMYVDGVLSGTTARVTANHSAPNYRIRTAVQSSLIHGGDNQFFKGAIRNLIVYNRPLIAAEVVSLNNALGAP